MAPDEERRRSKNRRSRPGKDSEPPGFVWEDQPAVPAEEGAFVPLQPSPKPEAPEAALDQDVERGEEDAAQVASEPLAALSTKSIVHFVKPSRLLISINLTTFPRPEETFFVPPVDATKEVSLGTTAAPTPDLDFSSHQFTTNGGGDGFSPGRSAAATAIHADRLDLASVSFTTTDPAVQSARMQLVCESGHDLARLEVIDHGEALLADIREKQQPSKRAVQRYLDRLKEIDFNGYSIPEKQRVAEAVNAITREAGLVLLCRDLKDEGRLKNVTNVKCFVSNERSKGSFRVWSGHHPVITETARGRFPALVVASTTEVTSALGVSEKNPQES